MPEARAAAPPEDLKPLTALRFFAAAWVVLYDYWPRFAAERPPVIDHGRLGVELFFVLSGFILLHVYGREWGEGRFGYRRFLWARLSRIYPVHIATLVGLGVLIEAVRLSGACVGEGVIRKWSLPAEALLMHAWGYAPDGGWNHPSWSLSAEWFAYVSFPAFAAAAWALRRRPALALAGAVAAGTALYAAFPPLAGFQLSQATTRFGWLRIVPPFAYGCALHLVWERLRRREGGAWLVPALVAAVSCVALAAATALRLPDAAAVLAAGGVILGLAALPPRAGEGRALRVLVYLGEVSFALYISVMPWNVVYENGVRKLLHLADDALLPFPVWLGLMAGVLPAAMALHHLVERPARAAMRAHGVPFTRRDRRPRMRPEGEEPAFAPPPG